jgi:hypothetical protein
LPFLVSEWLLNHIFQITVGAIPASYILNKRGNIKERKKERKKEIKKQRKEN